MAAETKMILGGDHHSCLSMPLLASKEAEDAE
jgi:hypothetical protein